MSTPVLLLLAAQAAEPSAAPADPPPGETQPLGPTDSYAGELVVTARRRTEAVQEVPIAVSVIGGQALVETGTYNVGRLTQLQPSLQFYSTNPRNSAANIRGLGAPFGLTNDGIEQGVGIYVDQVYYSRIASATFDFTDTERIEILRGPQGTLYGKNTTAGAINVTNRKPSFELEARGELSLGNYEFVQVKGSLSGPLVDGVVAARISTSITSRRGTIFNVRQREFQNSQDNQSVRAALLWEAADNLSVTLSGDYNRQDPNCCVQYYARVGTTQRPPNRQYAALTAAQGYAVPSTDPFDRLTDVDSDLRAKQELGGLSLLAEWELGPGILTSVSAYRFWDWKPSNDRDFIGLPITTVSANPSQQEQWSQELRFASTGTKRLDYVAGLFYFYQTIDTQGLQVQGPAASAFLLNPTSAGGRNPATLNGLTARNTIAFSNTSAALFGKLTWRPTDRLSVSPGLRLNYDRKRGSYVSVVTNGAGSTQLTADQRGVLAPQSYQPRFSEWNLSGDFTLAYQFADDVNGYATYARSYKSGGINLSGLPLDAANNPILSVASVDPETVDHFEVGLKTQFFDRRATVNIAAFWTEIRDYQATVTNNQVGVLRGYLSNAGKVRTRGFEIDSGFRPSDRVSLYANLAYTDAEYVRFVDAPCPPELSGGPNSPPNCDISGQVLPGVSKWAVSWGAEYRLPATLGDVEGDFYAGYDASYRSRFSSNPSPSQFTFVNGYSLHNFRLGFKTDQRWNIFAWLRNAFDENYFDLLATQAGNTGLVVGQPGDPRTYGVTISHAF